MRERAKANPKIKFLWDTQVTDILGDDKVSGLQVKNLKTDVVSELDVTGVFIAIGHRPNTELFAGKLDMEEDSGYLITQPDTSYTNVEGIFACGDVQDHVYRQAITAAGSGCMAAIDAERWLEAQHD
jgi:thioredoxin reductase (NADPH)